MGGFETDPRVRRGQILPCSSAEKMAEKWQNVKENHQLVTH